MWGRSHLDVDGERFAIRRAGDGGTGYDWLSGPNEGYGIGLERDAEPAGAGTPGAASAPSSP